MSNELAVSIKATLANGNLRVPFSQSINVDQDNAGVSSEVHAVSTSDAVIDIGQITTLGWLVLQNLDATNFVDYGPESGGALIPFGRLEPGEIASLRLTPGITPRWQADTAAVEVLATFYED